MKTRILWLVALAAILLGGCTRLFVRTSGSGQVRVDFRHQVDVRGIKTAVVETKNGAVEVRCEGSPGQADISGTKHARGQTQEEATARVEKIEVRIERHPVYPEVLNIVAVFPGNLPDAGASFTITLPADVGVTIRTSNGNGTVTGSHGDVNIDTNNGAITATSIGGKVRASTNNGGVTLRDVAGDVEVIDSNGPVDLRNVGQDSVTATTSNARIRATDTRGKLRLDTSNGPIDLHAGTPGASPDIRLATVNAAIQMELPVSLPADLALETTNAAVKADLDATTATQVRTSRGSLAATLNGGGGRVEAHTANGPIKVSFFAPAVPTAAAEAVEK